MKARIDIDIKNNNNILCYIIDILSANGWSVFWNAKQWVSQFMDTPRFFVFSLEDKAFEWARNDENAKGDEQVVDTFELALEVVDFAVGNAFLFANMPEVPSTEELVAQEQKELEAREKAKKQTPHKLNMSSFIKKMRELHKKVAKGYIFLDSYAEPAAYLPPIPEEQLESSWMKTKTVDWSLSMKKTPMPFVIDYQTTFVKPKPPLNSGDIDGLYKTWVESVKKEIYNEKKPTGFDVKWTTPPVK